METAGILPAILSFLGIRGPGVSRSETPKNQKAQPFGSASIPAIHAVFSPWKQPATAVLGLGKNPWPKD
jgi:hypothetical protein